jgi:hypothetical protein
MVVAGVGDWVELEGLAVVVILDLLAHPEPEEVVVVGHVGSHIPAVRV